MVTRKNYDGDIRLLLGYDPINALVLGSKAIVPAGRSKFEDALKLVSNESADLLRPLLRSGLEPSCTNALYVFSEMTAKKNAELVDDVIPFLLHPDPSARWYVLDGLLGHLSKLSAIQTAAVLRTCEDKEQRVRNKAFEVIAAMPLDNISDAIDAMGSEEAVDYHREGVDLQRHPYSQIAVETALTKANTILKCYVFGALIREAKMGYSHSIPDIVTGEEAQHLREKIQLIEKQLLRSRGS